MERQTRAISALKRKNLRDRGFALKKSHAFSDLFSGRFCFVLIALCLLFSGCQTESYPADKLKEALSDICRKEYGIENVDVKIIGSTIGVYLPLQKLFSADFKEAAITGKVRNLETLFEPSPEALEKVEDVLFSISRVILSTDKPLKFYVLEATDVEKTGMQLILTGCVNDIRRVRVWDISRNEYRKRVIHELKLNRAVVWHKPVRRFFKDLEDLDAAQVQTKYFGNQMPVDALQKLFFDNLKTSAAVKEKHPWNTLEMRSVSLQRNQALVYVKVIPPSLKEKNLTELQYLFVLAVQDDNARIARIVPFQYKGDDGQVQKIPFPRELKIQENVDRWDEEFHLEDVEMGSFLAAQLNRRIQGIAAADERIHLTFGDAKLDFVYHKDSVKPYFSLEIEAVLKDLNNYNRESLMKHEDMVYLLSLASQEFVELLRSYQFDNFDHLQLNLAQDSNPLILGRENLELFRRKKIDIRDLLAIPKI